MPSRTGQGKQASQFPVHRPGAHVNKHGVSYCVWAPDLAHLHVLITGNDGERSLTLRPDDEGYWSVQDPMGSAGDRYLFELPGGSKLPDPASRFQPEGVHGLSECIDPRAYSWETARPVRPVWRGQAIYELHVGTFTAEGTFRSAIAKLDHLRDLGVEMIQLLPLADFAGERNWGYDGVSFYAPARCYGRPDDLRGLVDAAHARGLGVILDVVYNHLGPVGNYLAAYCKDYFSPQHHTPWGPAFKLEGPRGRAVRDFVIGNVLYWLDEFRIDGFRLDATHAIPESVAERHLVAEISDAVHDRGGFVIAEDERNIAELMDASDAGGLGLDAVWSDDLHHQVRVALTGQRHSYFASYEGTTAALADVLEHGQTFRGQPFPFWKGKSRGNASRQLPTTSFVVCIENHDQVGNRARGERLEHTISARQFRAASLFLCLGPYVPMLFMGQEWAASSPFLFFTDFDAEYGRKVTEGRRREFGQIGLIKDPGTEFPDPQDTATFVRSKLTWGERDKPIHRQILDLNSEGLALRKEMARSGCFERGNWRVELLGEIIALRYDVVDHETLILISFGPGNHHLPPDSSLLQPPGRRAWELVLTSEDDRFGGSGADPNPLSHLTGPQVAVFTPQQEVSNAAR